MNEELVKTVKNYRDEFIRVLKANHVHFESQLTQYTTPGGTLFEYFKWNHPYQGSWEYEEIFTDTIVKFCQKYLDKNSVVIDIGAQAGLMSVLYSKFAGKVIAFEPNPAVYEVLERNSTIHKNIVPYNLACANSEEVLEFHYSDEGLCNGGFATKCEKGIGVTGHVVPIDVYSVNTEVFLNQNHLYDIANIKLIKIDAEGFDREILKTIPNIIRRIRPLLITEMYAGLVTSEVKDLIDTIYSYNYSIFNITKDNSGLGDESKRTKIKGLSDVNVGELCNFLCIPNE